MKKDYRVIDGDGHMQEPTDIWDKYVEKAYHDKRPLVSGHVMRYLFSYAPCPSFPEGRGLPRPDSVFADCPDRFGKAWDSWWSLPARIDAMKQEKVDIQVGFPTNGGAALSSHLTDAPLQAALCRAYNNWATDYCRDSKGKVQYIALVSMLDINEAIKEAKRASAIPAATAINMPDPGGSRVWSDAQFDPLWSALEELDLAASFHGGGSQQHFFKDLTKTPGLASVSHALAFPLDDMLAMGTLIFGGVLERHPNLRCSFLEANAGWLPWWLGRMDDHAVGRQGRFQYGKGVDMKPSDYFRRQCFVACDADEETLEIATERAADNLIFNTDWPHPDAPVPGAVNKFLSRPIPDATKKKILWDNSVKLYGNRVTAAAK
ncbi:MAG: amidohydrolase [SAR202 cluster bacterium]|nr:amidohydrolase [SAR202 cluster bacterium]